MLEWAATLARGGSGLAAEVGYLADGSASRVAAVFAAGCVRRQIAWGNLGVTPSAIEYSQLTAWAVPVVVFARFVYRCGELLSFLEPR